VTPRVLILFGDATATPFAPFRGFAEFFDVAERDRGCREALCAVRAVLALALARAGVFRWRRPTLSSRPARRGEAAAARRFGEDRPPPRGRGVAGAVFAVREGRGRSGQAPPRRRRGTTGSR